MKRKEIMEWASGVSFGLAVASAFERSFRKFGTPFLIGMAAGLGTASQMDKPRKKR